MLLLHWFFFIPITLCHSLWFHESAVLSWYNGIAVNSLLHYNTVFSFYSTFCYSNSNLCGECYSACLFAPVLILCIFFCIRIYSAIFALYYPFFTLFFLHLCLFLFSISCNHVTVFILVDNEDEGFNLIQPSLIQQLRGILDQYPADGQILKVMILFYICFSRNKQWHDALIK